MKEKNRDDSVSSAARSDVLVALQESDGHHGWLIKAGSQKCGSLVVKLLYPSSL
jgi:hypothetical protein